MKKYITSDIILKALANLPQLVFEVTDECNLNCRYCAYGELYEDYDCRENKKLPAEYAMRLIDYLLPYWNSNMNTSAISTIRISFYGGEPLLNFKFIERIVKYVENEIDCPNHIFKFSMTTNAILLDRYMDFLKEHDFSILVSLDGNEQNDAYRVDYAGHGSFNRVINNVDKLRDKYPEFFEKNINFNAVLHNKNSVEDIYTFFKGRYNKVPRIGELNTTGIRKDKECDFYKAYRNTEESLRQSEHYDEIERELFMESANYKSLAMFIFQYSGYVFDDYLDLLYNKEELSKLPTGTCLPFTKKMYVTVNGKILPCERIGHQFHLGYITDNDIILNIEDVAEKYNGFYSRMEKQCINCKNNKSCIQCLFNLKGMPGNPICYGYMGMTDFNNYVKRQMDFLKKHPEAYRKIMENVIRL